MSPFILDASVAVAWLLHDEKDARADAALARLAETEAFVPQVWHLEVRNSLLIAERRGRISGNEALTRLRSLKGLPIRTDAEPDLDAAFELARHHRLALYDAAYLELAKRRSGALASLDTALVRAAVAEGLLLIDA